MDSRSFIDIGIGAALGSFITYILIKKHYEDLANETISQYRKSRRENYSKKSNEDSNDKNQETRKIDYTAYYKSNSDFNADIEKSAENIKSELNKISNISKSYDIHMAEREYPEDDTDEEDNPYTEMKDTMTQNLICTIDKCQFYDSNEWFDKCTLKYNLVNGVITNDDDEVVEEDEAISLIGDCLDRKLENGDEIYIRNHEVGTDYEILVIVDKSDEKDSSMYNISIS